MGHSLGGLKPTFEPPLMRVPADLRNDEDIADSASRPPPKPGSSCCRSAYPLGGRWWSLVNSAGIAESNIPAEKYAGQAFRKTIDVNLIGAFVPQRWKYRGRRQQGLRPLRLHQCAHQLSRHHRVEHPC
ncbi:unnamed protein product [Zymoseptoria tritici ST99CH_3D1]|nr:unnamed protein product [Zymoseptoria tritici ST99CH_3D1]